MLKADSHLAVTAIVDVLPAIEADAAVVHWSATGAVE
jgi:hypothetical protein